MAKKGGGGSRKRGRSSNTNHPATQRSAPPPAAFLINGPANKKKNKTKHHHRGGDINDTNTGNNNEQQLQPSSAAAAAAATSASAASSTTTTASKKKDDDWKRVQRREHRRAVLTHETSEKKNTMRLKLHITRTKRELDTLKTNLESWDPVAYQKDIEEERKKQQEQEQEQDEQQQQLKKRRGRTGPESWKLKGAARPAWQVYDFDTRYVCPHIKAHEDHKTKTQRSFNLLALCRKQQQESPQSSAPPPPKLLPDSMMNDDNGDDDVLLFLCRDYLSLLMQLGHLYLEAKQYKSAREAWLECLALDYGGISMAGDSLMRMYLDLQRYQAALRLGQRLVALDENDDDDKSNSSNDSTVWIQYSAALVAFHLKHEKAQDYLIAAIRFNPLCAYYLAFWDTFDGVMEYTEELDQLSEQQQDDDGDEPAPQSSLEEAIEYCSSNDNQQAKRWISMRGHAALRDLLLQAIQGKHASLTPADVDWNARLVKLEQHCQEQEEAATAAAMAEVAAAETAIKEDGEDEEEDKVGMDDSSSEAADDDDDDEDNSDEIGPPKVDLAMFVGMFRTAMEMVQEEDARFHIAGH